MSRIVFITGTDTGVGKTLMTGLLLAHLRVSGMHALAVKPFACGSHGDGEILSEIQGGELPRKLVNPVYYRKPVAPLAAARACGKGIVLEQVMGCIEEAARRCDCLLVEGCGGLLVPLGEGYSLLEMIRWSGDRSELLVVAGDKLGVINHVLLTLRVLAQEKIHCGGVILTRHCESDPSNGSNGEILSELVAPVRLTSVEYLGREMSEVGKIRDGAKKIQKTLARICESVNLIPLHAIRQRAKSAVRKKVWKNC